MNNTTADGTTPDEGVVNTNVVHSGSHKFGEAYRALESFDLTDTRSKTRTTDTIPFVNIRERTAQILKDTTFKLWENVNAKGKRREINAAIKLRLVPKKIVQATEKVMMKLDEIDLNDPPKLLVDFIAKQVKSGQDQLKRQLKNTERKKYSEGAKNQASNSTKNGTASKKASTNSPATASKKKKAAREQKKKKDAAKSTANKKSTSNKKSTAKQTSTKKAKSAKDKAASQGRSNGGGATRGSGRR